MNNEVTVSNNTEVTVINTAGHRHKTILSTEGVSNVNQWLNIKIIRNASKDKNKMCNVSDNYIGVDMIIIKESNIPGTDFVYN